MSLPRYEQYKDCSTQWLVQIPEHWSTPPLYLRYEAELGKMLDTSRITGESLLPYLRNVDVQWGCINLDDLPEMDVGPSEISRYTVQQGDLLVCEGGEVGRSAVVGELVRPTAFQKALHRLRAIRTTEVPGYMLYVFRWAADAGAFASNGQSTIAHLTGEQLRKYRFPCPPQAEQTAIAAFLDRETAKIDALIAEQEKLIALLAEKRQATISHAVTRGLNPDAPMKDSGVAWLGEVPAHWTLPPLYLRYTVELGKMLDASRITGEHSVPYLRNVDVQWDSVNLDDLPCMDIEATEYARYTVRDGDLMVCEGGEVGRAAVVQVGDAVIGFQKALHRLRSISDQEDPRYMFYTFAWAANAGAFAGEGQSTIAHLTGEQLRKYRFPRPPHIEQIAISEFLDSEMVRLRSLAAEATLAVALLKERCSALIAAAVTGQIDVRDATERSAT